MAKNPITSYLSRMFNWSFLILVVSFIVIVVLSVKAPDLEGVTPIAAILLMVAASLAWLISLGVIAHRLGRRWLVWTGLSIIFSPIAPLIIQALMLKHIGTARATQAPPSEHSHKAPVR